MEFALTFQAASHLDAAIVTLSAALDALVAKVASQLSLPMKAENHTITITTDYSPATPPPDPTAPDPSFSPNPNQMPPVPPPPPDPDTTTDTTPRKKSYQKPKTHPAQLSQQCITWDPNLIPFYPKNKPTRHHSACPFLHPPLPLPTSHLRSSLKTLTRHCLPLNVRYHSNNFLPP